MPVRTAGRTGTGWHYKESRALNQQRPHTTFAAVHSLRCPLQNVPPPYGLLDFILIGAFGLTVAALADSARSAEPAIMRQRETIAATFFEVAFIVVHLLIIGVFIVGLRFNCICKDFLKNGIPNQLIYKEFTIKFWNLCARAGFFPPFY